jgi:hypothetical protein
VTSSAGETPQDDARAKRRIRRWRSSGGKEDATAIAPLETPTGWSQRSQRSQRSS